MGLSGGNGRATSVAICKEQGYDKETRYVTTSEKPMRNSIGNHPTSGWLAVVEDRDAWGR